MIVRLVIPFKNCHLIERQGSFAGLARSTDFTPISGQATPAPRPANASVVQQRSAAVGDINSHVFSANAALQPVKIQLDDSKKTFPDAGPVQDVPNVYQKITQALSLSMIYALSKNVHFLQIGLSHCVDARTVGVNALEFLESVSVIKESTTIACDARWLPNGSLQCVLSQITSARLYTLFDVLYRKLGFSLEMGDSIILSPSGLIGQYYGKENDHPPNYSSTNKTQIIAWLKRIGLSVPQNLKWVHVLFPITGQYENNEIVSTETNVARSLWPAHLCLCKDSQRARISESLDPEEVALDPLERAQSWFRGKSARAEAIEKGKQKEAEAEEARDQEGIDEEDTAADYVHQMSQQATPRDVSGIYPTPPDGVPSTSHDPSTSNNHQSTGASDAVTVNEMAAQDYGENANDELFGEMDIEMFATNGLTEDDFNFFDDANASGRNDQMFEGNPLMPSEADDDFSPLAEFSSPIFSQSQDTSVKAKTEPEDDLRQPAGNMPPLESM